MEGLYNKTSEYFNTSMVEYLHGSMVGVIWSISGIAFPIVCAAICGLSCLIKSHHHVSPVCVINLLLSDMLQICSKPVWHLIPMSSVMHLVFYAVYSIGLMASICFMLCIAAERYVLIVYPLWYRRNRTKNKSILVVLLVWIMALIVILIISLAFISGAVDHGVLYPSFIMFYLLPYPPIIFFTVGTWRALSCTKSVPPQEQKRIMGTLVLVLVIYTFFFLPYVIMMLALTISPNLLNDPRVQTYGSLVDILLSLNPIVDPFLYVVMRRDAKEMLTNMVHCCKKRRKNQPETPTP
ncbi:adrenocorticotropic hormone receptor-like [Engraulis encrasicolus]|uniref:adrenocorticotropic hormone receptor-like n=1 Tax=Engraulis encrasicolus TaxID=184585 RepID=UPI002FD5E6CB